MKILMILTLAILAGCAKPDPKKVTQDVNINTPGTVVTITPTPIVIHPAPIPGGIVKSDAQLVQPCNLPGLAPIMFEYGVYSMFLDNTYTDGYDVDISGQDQGYSIKTLNKNQKYWETSDHENCTFMINDANQIEVLEMNSGY